MRWRVSPKSILAKHSFFNGSNQRIDQMQRQQWLHIITGLPLSFQNRHHLSLCISVGLSSNLCSEARFGGFAAKMRKKAVRGPLQCRKSATFTPRAATLANTPPSNELVGTRVRNRVQNGSSMDPSCASKLAQNCARRLANTRSTTGNCDVPQKNLSLEGYEPYQWLTVASWTYARDP